MDALATDIFTNEFDSDPELVSQQSILEWLNANIGTLNTLLYTDYTAVDLAADEEAMSIYKDLYMESYYKKQARNALRGLLGDGGGVLSLRDGNSSVSFTNKNEIAKVYKGLAEDARAKIKDASGRYTKFKSTPIQVAGTDSFN